MKKIKVDYYFNTLFISFDDKKEKEKIINLSTKEKYEYLFSLYRHQYRNNKRKIHSLNRFISVFWMICYKHNKKRFLI